MKHPSAWEWAGLGAAWLGTALLIWWHGEICVRAIRAQLSGRPWSPAPWWRRVWWCWRWAVRESWRRMEAIGVHDRCREALRDGVEAGFKAAVFLVVWLIVLPAKPLAVVLRLWWTITDPRHHEQLMKQTNQWPEPKEPHAQA